MKPISENEGLRDVATELNCTERLLRWDIPANGSKSRECRAYLRKQLKAGITDFSAQPQGLTPRAAVSLLMRRPEKVAEQQQQALVQMRQLHPEIEQAMELVASFLKMLRTLQGQQLETWMETAQQGNIREMQNFVEKLRKDQQAVQAGLTLTWSNGVVEGHVHRLKLVKRQGYGRATFPLLRKRVLARL